MQLYETTDPALGEASEEDKIERARQAISIRWYLFGELLLWAQSHLAGYEIAKAKPEFVDRLARKIGDEVTKDSHVLEYIGLLYSWNNVNYDDPLREKIEEEMEKADVGLDTPALRCLIRELLVSRSANSSFWRFELQHALYALNLGHVDDLFKPDPTRRQGNPVELLRWKVMALQHVYFQVGKGMKKYRALDLVAEAIGQSVETLRSWEKFISGDDDFEMEIRSAKLAGRLESELDKLPLSEVIKLHGVEYCRHSADVEYAKIILRQIRAATLEEVRKRLRTARMSKKSGS